MDGHRLEGFWRAHQVPHDRRARRTPSICSMLENWMRSYKPQELFDANGKPIPELKAARPPARAA